MTMIHANYFSSRICLQVHSPPPVLPQHQALPDGIRHNKKSKALIASLAGFTLAATFPLAWWGNSIEAAKLQALTWLDNAIAQMVELQGSPVAALKERCKTAGIVIKRTKNELIDSLLCASIDMPKKPLLEALQQAAMPVPDNHKATVVAFSIKKFTLRFHFIFKYTYICIYTQILPCFS